MDLLRDLLGPGLIFLLLCFWLVRKVVKAARTESELESERLSGAFAEELQRGRDNARASRRPQGAELPIGAQRPMELRSRPELIAVPLPAPDSPDSPSPGAPPLSLSPRATPPRPAAATPFPALAGADLAAALDEHLPVVAALVEEREAALLTVTPLAVRRRVEVLWVRSASGHVAWCERRHPAVAEITLVREVICVARVKDGKAVERWSFG